MEFVVIAGEESPLCDSVANKLRAHGFRFFSTDMFFIDDSGEYHYDAEEESHALEWCVHRAYVEVQKQQDIVVQGTLFNSELMKKAESNGYRIVVLRCDTGCEQRINEQVADLILLHQQSHPSLLQRLFG